MDFSSMSDPEALQTFAQIYLLGYTKNKPRFFETLLSSSEMKGHGIFGFTRKVGPLRVAAC